MLLVIVVTLAPAIGFFAFAPARGQVAIPIPRLSLTVYAGEGSQLVFIPAQIKIPQVPIILNVTVVNNGTVGPHTFSINDGAGNLKIDLFLANGGDRGSVEFQINESATTAGALGQIYYNGSAFAPVRSSNGIQFYCRPHQPVGMVGEIVLATLGGGAAEEKGFFLRAYWIGIIALAAMLLWTGITYFVIKSSSRHFSDHGEHIRRGLP